jgi:hypothetical protein
MSRTCLSLSLVLLLAGVAAAQQPSKPIALTLGPPKASPRKLQYPLLVPVSEQVPGNAVTDYKTANEKHQQLIKEDGYQTYQQMVDAWNQMPLDELPRKEMAEFFDHYKEVYAAIEAGAHKEHADWEHLDGLRKKGFQALLGEDIQRVRRLIQLINVRIRYYEAEGKIDKALKDLQMGYTLARHAGQSPTLIGSLVAIALAHIMTERLDEILQQPNVPSLYWSLTDVPPWMGGLRRPMQAERLSGYGSFPGILECANDLDAGPITAEEVQGIVKVLAMIENVPPGVQTLAYELKIGFAINKRHEAAKQALIAAGRPKEKVEAMPPVQVAILHALLEYDRVFDELMAVQDLPPWEANPKLGQYNRKKLEEDANRADGPAIPLVARILPVTQKVYRTHLRIERRFAALRCVEALRLYAAAHDGRFPASLKQIKDVPIPVDPGTGKDFEYQLRDDKATLTGPALGGESNTYPFAFTYELTFKR